MMTAYKHKKTMLELMVVKVFMMFPTMFPDYYKAYINVSPPPE